MKISFRVAAVASLSSLAFVAASGITASAQANPNNHGHHYGQLKHPKTFPPPVPVPIPTPVPTPHPVTQPPPTVVPVVHSPRAGNVSSVPVQQRAPVSAPSSDPITPVLPAFQVNDVTGLSGQYDWLILLILPSLLAVWLIALVGLARRFSLTRKKVMQVQAAPA